MKKARFERAFLRPVFGQVKSLREVVLFSFYPLNANRLTNWYALAAIF